jgi:hypothetical protein
MTLAHEFAHVLFDPVFNPAALHSTIRDTFDERVALSQGIIAEDASVLDAVINRIGLEKLCDELAFELLFPAKWALKLASSATDLTSVVSVAHRFDVSLTLATIRLNEATGDRRSLLQLRPTCVGDWVVAETVRPPRGWSEGVRLSMESSRMIGSLAWTGHPLWREISTQKRPERLLGVDLLRRQEMAVGFYFEQLGPGPRSATPTPS